GACALPFSRCPWFAAPSTGNHLFAAGRPGAQPPDLQHARDGRDCRWNDERGDDADGPWGRREGGRGHRRASAGAHRPSARARASVHRTRRALPGVRGRRPSPARPSCRRAPRRSIRDADGSGDRRVGARGRPEDLRLRIGGREPDRRGQDLTIEQLDVSPLAFQRSLTPELSGPTMPSSSLALCHRFGMALRDGVRGRTVRGAMSEPDSDQVRADDSKIPPAPPAPTQVCIISSDPLRAFIGALSPALRAREEFTIIVDRRRAGLENVAVRPAIERRHHPSIDTKVNRDGFAIVSLSTTDALPWIEHVVDHQPAYDDAGAEVDWREYGRIVESQHRSKAWIGPLVRISAIVGAFSVLVVLFVQMTAGPVALPTWERTSEPPLEAQAAAVTEVPVAPSVRVGS